MTTDIDMDATYRVKGWPEVAVRIHGYPKIWEPYRTLITVCERCEHTLYETFQNSGVWISADCGCEMCDDENQPHEPREVEVDTDEGEEIDDTECGDVLVVMVGDDAKHRVSVDDLIPLDDLDYCAECGQIGCGHDGKDRS